MWVIVKTMKRIYPLKYENNNYLCLPVMLPSSGKERTCRVENLISYHPFSLQRKAEMRLMPALDIDKIQEAFRCGTIIVRKLL